MDTTITIQDFAKVEMRVGRVVEAANKEGSEKLIRLVVDFGLKSTGSTKSTGGTGSEEGEGRELRVIFTGVRAYGYTPGDFLNKQFFFITNLAPRKMMDEESQGMILAVDGDELPFGKHGEKKPVFISADGMPVGARIR